MSLTQWTVYTVHVYINSPVKESRFVRVYMYQVHMGLKTAWTNALCVQKIRCRKIWAVSVEKKARVLWNKRDFTTQLFLMVIKHFAFWHIYCR